MQSHLEESLQHDIDAVRSKVIQMGELAESALQASLEALGNKNRQIAYSVILRDRYIDEAEKELDRLCQEFLVRQQPVAGNLRFVYATIKINNELERVGDYAESIARQFLTVSSIDTQPFYQKIVDIANLSIPMLRNAVQSFAKEDPELAKATMDMEEKVDSVRYGIHSDMVQLHEKGKLSAEALPPLMIIASRFERVADQACNICEEVLYMCTGEDIKHKGKEVIRVLFVDERDACRGQMAQGIANSLGLDRFMFTSAGISPRPVDQRTIKFLAGKGIDISQQTSKYLNQVLDLDNYQVIVALCEAAEEAFPAPPTKTVSIRWEIENPSKIKGSKEEIQNAYDNTFQYLDSHIRDLMQAIIGDSATTNEKEKR